MFSTAILTVSDKGSAGQREDRSSEAIRQVLARTEASITDYAIVPDEKEVISRKLAQWADSLAIDLIITTGGTGFYPRDVTPEAICPLFDKPIEGFGELFRAISYKEIGTSTIQSRAFGGMANNTAVFCLPGSQNACKTGWQNIIAQQLDSQSKPCNFVEHLLGPE